MEYLGSLAKEFIFFSGDVQTTTIAVAITGSLCCSIVIFIAHVVTWVHSLPLSQHNASLHLKESATVGNKAARKVSSKPPLSCAVSRSSRHMKFKKLTQMLIRQEFSTVCSRCETVKLEQNCRFGLCEQCSVSRIGSYSDGFHIPYSDNPKKSPYSPLERLRKFTEVIDLSSQKIGHCPDRLGYIGAQLTSLNLSNNNLAILPDEIGCLRGLQELYLHRNLLSTLPDSLGTLESLIGLDVRQNCLQSLPDCVTCLSSLKYLNMSSNRLQTLPSCLKKLLSLEGLWLRKNEIEVLPEELCLLPNLQVLDVSNNPLDRLPAGTSDLVRLTMLDVSSCKLTTLQPALTRCAALATLNVANNRLKSLPVQIGRLHCLQQLDVHGNDITVFPISLGCLQLVILDAQDNPILERNNIDRYINVPDTEFPPLLELSARCITQNKVVCDIAQLPFDVQELLSHDLECTTCEGPCFTYFSSKVTFHPICVQHQWLPLLERLCSPHCRFGCKFRA